MELLLVAIFTPLLYIKKMDNKTVLRIKAKNIRHSLQIHKVSENLIKLVRGHDFYKKSKNVMIFYPTKYEINLLPLLNDDKNFYLPRVNGDYLSVCPYIPADELKKSEFNILEPCSKPVDADVLDLVIVPALMADKYGYRLGYGGGFYDRFLAQHCSPKMKTLVTIPLELYVDELPHDDFDVPVDEIICT